MLKEDTKRTILRFQRYEITESIVYAKLATRTKGENSKILKRISEDERRHYEQLKGFTERDLSPNRLLIFKYLVMTKILGLTFGIKLMERGEKTAEKNYRKISEEYPEFRKLLKEEVEHERMLIGMIDEERLGYIGSMVLGLNDALVELTGALAGFTLALQNTKLIAVAGFITGVSASLSMSASEYLSKKSEGNGKSPLRASFYTGFAYILTVFFLVMPYFILSNYYLALVATKLVAISVIFGFTFFVSVVKNLSFKNLFFEMSVISVSVAVASFIIGSIARRVFDLEL